LPGAFPSAAARSPLSRAPQAAAAALVVYLAMPFKDILVRRETALRQARLAAERLKRP
jgi:hypothetical protein